MSPREGPINKRYPATLSVLCGSHGAVMTTLITPLSTSHVFSETSDQVTYEREHIPICLNLYIRLSYSCLCANKLRGFCG
jgi:hypothetical protein